MKNYSLQPTDENAIELLRTDPIGRNDNVFRFVELLNNIDECCTIAINGEWGTGKTFFVRQVILVLDALNPQSSISEDVRNIIKSLLPERIEDIGDYATVYYDAWTYDNDDDPILSLIHATISSGQSNFAEEKQRSILDGVAALAEALTSRNITSLLKEARGKDWFETLKDADSIRRIVREFLDALIQEHGNRLVVFVDELDRCKPDYAVRFLERIKHYFYDERITFVFSVSVSQLECTVRNYYGAEFNAVRYLDKFFDLRMSLPGIDHDRFIRERLNLAGNTRLDSVCIETVKHFGLSLRETERYVRLIKISVRAAFSKMSNTYSDGNALRFSVMYFIPIMLGLQMTDMRAYLDFINGINSGPLAEILMSPNVILLDYLFLNWDEEYNAKTHTILVKETKESIPVSNRLKEIYSIAFSKGNKSNRWEVNIGDICFSDEIMKEVEEIAALLSPFSDYRAE